MYIYKTAVHSYIKFVMVLSTRGVRRRSHGLPYSVHVASTNDSLLLLHAIRNVGSQGRGRHVVIGGGDGESRCACATVQSRVEEG